MEISKITSPSEWVYFAKGNANILFKYTGNNDYLRHKLLRVRLLKEDKQYILTCELYDFIELSCKHLFPEQIVDIQLVVLTSDFINLLDNKGNALMVRERYGLLIPNILDRNYTKCSLLKNCQLYYYQLPNNTIELAIFEIKPKWFYDNKSSNYCRTCLLNQLKGFERHFCPLDLLYKETMEEGINDIFRPIPNDLLVTMEESKFPLRTLFQLFLDNPENVFQKLKQYQRINNKNDLIKNLTSINDVLLNLLLIMTLRDVGLFIKFEKYNMLNNVHNSQNNKHNIMEVPGYGKFVITCNIYDLDLKSNMKYKHWLEVEQKLQNINNSSNPNWKFCVRFKDDSHTDNLDPFLN